MIAYMEYQTDLKREPIITKHKPKYRFLVTGGAGFIGSHIVERLLSEGHFVRVLDNFSSGKQSNLDFTYDLSPITYDLIKGDIRDYSTCANACEGIDYVLHQAALRSVPQSLERPHEYNEVNIDGTVNMLKAALKNRIKRFIFASTCAIYGECISFPQKENDESRPISPYALTKLAGEYYCRIFSYNYGLETVCLRYFNVFGPKQSLENEYAIVVPKFVTCMLDDKNPPIHGTGNQSRDFIYVSNVADANLLAAVGHIIQAKGDARQGLHEIFNVGTGQCKSIAELVDTLNKIMNKSIKPTFMSPRPGDVLKSQADILKINRLLGYKPYISFEEGLRKTKDYFENLACKEVF